MLAQSGSLRGWKGGVTAAALVAVVSTATALAGPPRGGNNDRDNDRGRPVAAAPAQRASAPAPRPQAPRETAPPMRAAPPPVTVAPRAPVATAPARPPVIIRQQAPAPQPPARAGSDKPIVFTKAPAQPAVVVKPSPPVVSAPSQPAVNIKPAQPAVTIKPQVPVRAPTLGATPPVKPVAPAIPTTTAGPAVKPPVLQAATPPRTDVRVPSVTGGVATVMPPRTRAGTVIPAAPTAGVVVPPRATTTGSTPIQSRPTFESANTVRQQRTFDRSAGFDRPLSRAETFRRDGFSDHSRWNWNHHSSSRIFINFGVGFEFGAGSVFVSSWPHHWVHRPWGWRGFGCDPFWRPSCCWPSTWVWAGDPWCGSRWWGDPWCEPTWVFARDPWCAPRRTVFVYDPFQTVIYQTAPVVTVTNPSTIAVASTYPAPASAAELLTTSDRELGDTYLRLGDPDNAARIYQQHLAKHPGDAEATRSLGVALIVAGRSQEGAEQIGRAYRIDPMLADRPFRTDLLASPAEFKRALDQTTRWATSTNTPDAWLASAALLQADGSSAAARGALDKARAAGLEDGVFNGMQGVLPSATTAPSTTPQP